VNRRDAVDVPDADIDGFRAVNSNIGHQNWRSVLVDYMAQMRSQLFARALTCSSCVTGAEDEFLVVMRRKAAKEQAEIRGCDALFARWWRVERHQQAPGFELQINGALPRRGWSNHASDVLREGRPEL